MVAFGRLAVSHVVADNARDGTVCFVVVRFRVAIVILFSRMCIRLFANTRI